MNTDKGRRAAEAMSRGDWTPGDDDRPVSLVANRPTIFALYEQNIGPLTPLIADTLKDAEATYPQSWIAEAVQIAVEVNKRNWRYIEAILRRWTTEGKSGAKANDAQAVGAVDEYLRDPYFERQQAELSGHDE
jgi:DnaD/phage-associated family protein